MAIEFEIKRPDLYRPMTEFGITPGGDSWYEHLMLYGPTAETGCLPDEVIDSIMTDFEWCYKRE